MRIEKFIHLLIKYQIRPQQAMILYLFYTQNYKEVYRYINEFKPDDFHSDCLDLEEKGFLINLNKEGEPSWADHWILTEEAEDSLFLETNIAGEELIDKYPKALRIRGEVYPLITGDIDNLKEVYAEKIKNSKSEHKSVLNALEEQKEKTGVRMGLEKWIRSEQWRFTLDEEENQDNFSQDL